MTTENNKIIAEFMNWSDTITNKTKSNFPQKQIKQKKK